MADTLITEITLKVRYYAQAALWDRREESNPAGAVYYAAMYGTEPLASATRNIGENPHKIVFSASDGTTDAIVVTGLTDESDYFAPGTILGPASIACDHSYYGSSQTRADQTAQAVAARLAAVFPPAPTTSRSLDISAHLTPEQIALGLGETSPVIPAEELAGLYQSCVALSKRVGVFWLKQGDPTTISITGTYGYRTTIEATAEAVPGQPTVLFIDGSVRARVMLKPDGTKVLIFNAFGSNGTACAQAADAAKVQYDKLVRKFIALRAEGQAPTEPGPRPPETIAACLAPDEREYLNKWWESTQAMLSAAKAGRAPTADEAYDNYVQGGGNKTKEDWNADRESRINDAVGEGATTSGWFDKLGSALGWVGEKAMGAISWLGESALDLAKTWGPWGTVGAFAGFKALGGGGPSWLLPVVLAGAAILLLK